MGKFIRHEKCPKCGSRDNLGRYNDGSAFCFGCRYTEPREAASISHSLFNETSDRLGVSTQTLHGCTGSRTESSENVRILLSRYGISQEEVWRAGGYYDPRRDQLTFEYRDTDGELCCVQARNLDSEKALKHKYYNQGSTYDVFDLMGNNGKSKVCITEDKLSAIKVARQVDAIPALGTQFQRHKLARLAALGYQKVYVWLDADKWREGRDIADHCKWLGLSSKALLTPKDPKEYTDEQIKEFLK